ncbi:MAG: InlB B-repeat-containing protein [Christensenellales bacterium]|nr:InlB B-repeat-containing protein [Christensenellales bacterium]
MSEAQMHQPLLEVKGLKEYFDINMGFFRTKPLKAVDDVSFTINKGETLGLVGESGCGKTTVGRTILQLYKPTAGEIIYDGKPVKTKADLLLLLCSIIWAGTASAAMIVNNNMSALNTLNTINNNQTPQGKDSALMRLAQEIGAGMWDNTDWDAPAFQQNIKQLGITVLNKDTQPPEAFIGDAIFDHLGNMEFNAPEMNGNLLVLGGLNANLPSGKIDRLYVLSDEDVRLNIGAAADVQELILGASGNVSLNGEGNVRSTIVVDKPMNLDIGIATNLVNLTDDPLPTGDIVLNPGKNALVPGQQLHMGSELKVEKKISLTVRFRLVDQSAKDMQLETADWDGALLTETTVQYTGDSCPMGAVNMMDSIEAAFAEKYPDLQEQYVLLPEMRSADPWSKVYRLNGGESCFAVAENYVYLSREGDVVFPLTDDSTLVAEFPVYVYRYGEQDGRITYRVRISGARPDYFTPSLTLRSGAVASFTFDKERGEWVTQFKRSDFGADERALIHLTGLRGEETDTFLPVTGREEKRIVTLTWTADTQRVTIDAQNVLWGSDMPAEGNDLLCRAGEQVTVQIAPAAGYRGIHVFQSDPAVSLSISEGNDAVSFLMPYAPLTLTLTADKLYTVTMDTAGGDPIRPIQYTVESEAFQLPTPVRTGYIFLGWTGEGITEPQKTMEIPQGSTGNRTYTANWQVIEYTVTLDVSGGDPLDPITYTVETPVILPTPTSTGYTFLGWTGEGETTPQPTVVLPKGTTGDKAYTANWKVITYTIALGANGGEDLAAISYTIESDPIKLPTPERKGYEFMGWIGDGIDGAQPEVIIPTGSTGDRTYIALWRVIAYFIELRQSSGNWMQNIPYTVEEEVKLPIPTREGYEFIGWVGEDIIDAQINVTIPRGSTGFRLYAAHWALENYTITLDTSGGNALDNIRYTVKSDPIILPTPTRNGYEFSGWTGEGITTPQTEVIIPTGSTGNKAYTANWQVIEYTITLDTNGGPVVSPIKYTVEDSFTLPYPLRPGYEFVGWTLDGSGMLPAMPLIIYYGTTGNLRYKAEWRLAEYTITMDLDGGSGQEKVVYTITDEDFELPTPTRNGYEFVGWTGERITTPQTRVKIPKGSTGNKAYTANWKVIRYTITLVTNGGAVIASIRYTVEDSVTLPIPPDRPGYEFAGWVLDGSGQFPSTPMIIPKGSTGDRIYKAEWRVATYTITYVSHGKAYNWVQYTINNQVYFGTPEEDPSYYLPGYTFVGWQIDGVSGTPLSYMLPKGSYGNRTATMLWEAIP